MAGIAQIKPVTSLAPFASPDDVDPTLQLFLEEANARLCKWFGHASKRGPLPLVSVLPEVAPAMRGLTSGELLDELELVMEGAYQPSHPGALAHLDPPPLTASIAADLICSGLNNNLLAEELSPSLSRLEKKLCSWFADCLGLPASSGGVAASGGSLSNLMALVVARSQAGLRGDPNAVVLTSCDAHVSVLKAIRVMGLADDSLEFVPTDDDGTISMDALESCLSGLRNAGRKCFAVVATAGSTARGAVDPLDKLSEFCRKEALWLHVDAAIGGAFALSPKKAHLIGEISKADSVTLNPQKLLGIPKTSSLLLVADRDHLLNTFSTGLPYMEPPGGLSHGGELGLQGSRPAEVLKLWLGLRQLGQEGINHLLDGALNRRSYLQNQLDISQFNIVSGPLHLISVTPKGVDRDKAQSWSASTRDSLLKNNLMLSRPLYRERYYLKVVLGNPHTTTEHLDLLATLLKESLLEESH